VPAEIYLVDEGLRAAALEVDQRRLTEMLEARRADPAPVSSNAQSNN